jgi:hypothetical protein
MPKRRKSRKPLKGKRGGSVAIGLLGAIKKALPSYLLYQAVKMQQRGGKSRRGGGCGCTKKGGRKRKRKTKKRRKKRKH